MATSVAALQVTVGADISSALSGLNKLNGAVSSAGGFFGRAASTAAGFIGGALGLQALQGVAGGAGDAIFGFNASLEQSQTSFGVMLGSGAKAQSFLESLQSFALATPFEFPQLVSASQRMLAFGFSASQVIPLLTDIGNVASASPSGFAAGLDRISLALGQMQAKGKVQGDELLQLQEAGVNTGQVFEIMAQQTGKTVPRLQAMSTAGKLLPATFIKAFQAMSKARFGGLMDKQSQTFTGAVSNIRDGLRGALAKGFLPLFNAVRGGAVQFANFLQTPAFQAWVARLATGVAGLVTWFKTNLPAAWVAVQNAWAMLQPKLAALAVWLQTNLPAAWAMLEPKLVALAGWLQTNIPAAWAALSPKFAELRDWLSVNIPAAWAVLEPKFTALADWLKTTLPAAGTQLSSMWTNLQATLGPFVPTLGTAADAMAKLAGAVVSLAVVDLGTTLLALGTFAAIMSAPAFIAGVVSLAALAISAAPLLLLAGALATIAVVIKQNWPEITTIVGEFFSKLDTGVQNLLQGLKILGGLLVALTMPDVLKQNNLTLPQVLSSAKQGTSLFDLVNQGKNPVFGVNTATSLGITPPPGALPLGALPPPTAATGGTTVDNSDRSVTINNPSVRSDADLQALLDQRDQATAAAAADGQESAANTAPADLVGSS
jgi:tape measure domain-containing protein